MHHDPALVGLLQVTAALLLVVVSAQVCGQLALRLRQPAVVGEMVSGVLLGPTLLGSVAPRLSGYLFSDATRPTLYAIAMVGLSLYMFLVGIDHVHPRTSRRDSALPVALGAGGMLGPIVVGGGAALLLVPGMRPDDTSPFVYVLFVGGALSVAAFPMLARVLQERRMVRTEFGRIATSAAAIDDALAWCLLAVCGALAVHGTLAGSLLTIVPAVVLAVVSFLVLPRVFRRPIEDAVRRGSMGDGLVATLLAVVLAVGWVTDYIGIYSVFGGFICGMALPKVPGFPDLASATLMKPVRCLMLPVFFAFSGLNTDLRAILDPAYLLPLAGLLVVACVAKTGVGYAMLRWVFGWTHGESLAMGALMNARGLMILIFINAGLAMGIIPRPLFSMLVVVAVVSTAMALPIYRLHFTPEREEEARRALEDPRLRERRIRPEPVPSALAEAG